MTQAALKYKFYTCKYVSNNKEHLMLRPTLQQLFKKEIWNEAGSLFLNIYKIKDFRNSPGNTEITSVTNYEGISLVNP